MDHKPWEGLLQSTLVAFTPSITILLENLSYSESVNWFLGAELVRLGLLSTRVLSASNRSVRSRSTFFGDDPTARRHNYKLQLLSAIFVCMCVFYNHDMTDRVLKPRDGNARIVYDSPPCYLLFFYISSRGHHPSSNLWARPVCIEQFKNLRLLILKREEYVSSFLSLWGERKNEKRWENAFLSFSLSLSARLSIARCSSLSN